MLKRMAKAFFLLGSGTRAVVFGSGKLENNTTAKSHSYEDGSFRGQREYNYEIRCHVEDKISKKLFKH